MSNDKKCIPDGTPKFCTYCGACKHEPCKSGCGSAHFSNREHCAYCGHYISSDFGECGCPGRYPGSGYKSKDGCFITTAVLRNIGILDDKCYELETFRKFRDTYIQTNHPNLVDEYYVIAPTIVAKLNETKARTANKGFAIVGRNCKVQRQFFGSTFVQN